MLAMHADMMPFQRTGARFLAQREAAILCDEMGVGKTWQWIGACDEVGAKRVLVLAPGIARLNWVREFQHVQTKPRDVGAIMKASLIPDTDVVIAPYHLLGQERVLKYLLSQTWDVLIQDEAHLIKNQNAFRTQTVYGMKCDGKAGISKRSRQKWPGSGTITPNNVSELWPHCSALLPQVARGKTFDEWVDRYCHRKRGSDKIVANKKENAPELAALLRPWVLRRLSKDVLPELPPLRFSQVPVMPDKLPEKSREIAETEAVVAGAIAALDRGKTEQSQAALAALNEVHLASLRKWTGIAKAPAIGEYVAYDLANGLDKVLVFAQHREVIEIIAGMLPESAFIHGGVTNPAKRQRILDGFQGLVPGFCPRALVVSIDIANAALTLTAACNVVFAETSWVPKDLEQAVKRCHRKGQTRPVTARLFSLAGSIDNTIGATLVRKLKQTASFYGDLTVAN